MSYAKWLSFCLGLKAFRLNWMLSLFPRENLLDSIQMVAYLIIFFHTKQSNIHTVYIIPLHCRDTRTLNLLLILPILKKLNIMTADDLATQGAGTLATMLSMVKCKTAVSPVLMPWRYCSLALGHRYHGCLSPGSLCRQLINSHDIDLFRIGKITWLACVKRFINILQGQVNELQGWNSRSFSFSCSAMNTHALEVLTWSL